MDDAQRDAQADRVFLEIVTPVLRNLETTVAGLSPAACEAFWAHYQVKLAMRVERGDMSSEVAEFLRCFITGLTNPGARVQPERGSSDGG